MELEQIKRKKRNAMTWLQTINCFELGQPGSNPYGCKNKLSKALPNVNCLKLA